MNKFGLLLGMAIFSLLFLTSVKANLLNLTGQSPTTIYEDGDYSNAVWHRSIHSTFDANLNKWFLGIHTSGGNYYISKWDYNLTQKELGWTQVGTSVNVKIGSKMMDYNTTDLVIYWFEAIKTLNRSFVNKNTLTVTYDRFLNTVFTALGDYMGIGVADDYTVAYLNQTGGSGYSQKLIFIDPDGDNKTALCPICSVGNVSDLDLVAIPEYNEYWLFARVGSVGKVNETCSKAVVSRYYYNSVNNRYETKGLFDYATISTQCVLDVASHQQGGTAPSYIIEGTMDVKRMGKFIYVITKEIKDKTTDWNNTVWLYAIDIDNYVNTNNIVRTEEVHDLEDYDSNLNAKLGIEGLGLGYNSIQNTFVLFYQRFNSTITRAQGSISYHDYSLSSIFSCGCSVWVNTGSCGTYIEGFQKQTRVCAPEQCTQESQYVDCTIGLPTITEKKETFCDVCTTGKKIPQNTPQAKCSISKEIPANAKNILSNATWTLSVKIPFSFTSEDMPNWYRLVVCNPRENCFDQEYYCNQNNITATWNYNNYQAGQIANAEFGISQASSCKLVRKFIVDIGWSEYTIDGQLCLYYNVSCGGWVCTTEGFNEYLQYENSDCSREPINASNFCQFGCENSECLSQANAKEGQSDLEQTAKNIAQPVGQIFSFALTGLDAMFPTSDLKILGAFVFTVSITLGISLLTRKKEGVAIGLVAGLFMLFFFMIRSYIPLWIGVLIAIPEIGFIILLIVPTSKVK